MSIQPRPVAALAGVALPPRAEPAANILHEDNRIDDVGYGTYLRVRTKIVDWDPRVIATLPPVPGINFENVFCRAQSWDGQELPVTGPIAIERDGQEVSFVVCAAFARSATEDQRFLIHLGFGGQVIYSFLGFRSGAVATGESAPSRS